MTTELETEIIAYLRSNNNRLKNAAGMEIGINSCDELWTDLKLVTLRQGPLALSISTEEENLAEFIESFGITTLNDLFALNYTSSWMRYLNSDADIEITPFDLESTLTFRIHKEHTTIRSLELRYYDEVYEHLTMFEDFSAYVDKNEKRLHFFAQNRFKKFNL